MYASLYTQELNVVLVPLLVCILYYLRATYLDAVNIIIVITQFSCPVTLRVSIQNALIPLRVQCAPVCCPPEPAFFFFGSQVYFGSYIQDIY